MSSHRCKPVERARFLNLEPQTLEESPKHVIITWKNKGDPSRVLRADDGAFSVGLHPRLPLGHTFGARSESHRVAEWFLSFGHLS